LAKKKEQIKMSDKIYINLVPNPKYTEGSNLPVMVGPANPNAPEGKNWTIGVKMPDGTWWNQAAFASKDEVGGLTIILTPSNSAAKPAGGFQQKTFAAKPTYGKTNTGFKNQF
jgi:hypothetical protein